MKKANYYLLGFSLTFIGGILWGFSGVCGQYLFNNKEIVANWLVPNRLFFSGLILILYSAYKMPKKLFKPILDYKLYPAFLMFSLLGLMLTQYYYFYSIELSNAAISTVIQYSAPAMILAIVCLNEKRFPKIKEFVALILAILGVIILATHGNLNSLVISKKALIYALLSAVCVCFYNFVPKKLNQKYPLILTLGWAMLFGGIVLGLWTKVWSLKGIYDISGFLALLGVIFFGTVLAFSFYLLGVKIIGAAKASLIAAIEPVSSALFAHFWLKTQFAFLDLVGFVLIICCILLLAKNN